MTEAEAMESGPYARPRPRRHLSRQVREEQNPVTAWRLLPRPRVQFSKEYPSIRPISKRLIEQPIERTPGHQCRRADDVQVRRHPVEALDVGPWH